MPPSRCARPRNGSRRAGTRLRRIAAVLVLCVSAQAGFSAEIFTLDGLRVTATGDIGPSSLRFDLVVIGDGYIADDFRPGGRWDRDSARLVKNFFERKPFKELRSVFNVFVVEAVSLDRGIDDVPGQDTRRTIFNCSYGSDGINRLMTIQDPKALVRALRNAPGADAALLLVNDRRFGGCGAKAEHVPVGACSNDSRAFATLVHELGHSLANLGDEYEDAQVAATYALPAPGDLPNPNLTLARCVDTSSADALIDSLKWGHFLTEPNAKKRYGKGYYEGGFYRTSGVYRPAPLCIMRDDSYGKFCYVCEEEMTTAIYRRAGRGPGGGVFPAPVPRMKVPMRRAHHLYSMGLFGETTKEIARVEKLTAFPAECRPRIAELREGIAASLKEGLARADAAVNAGEWLIAHELLSLLAVSFEGTDGETAVGTRKEAVTQRAGFARELKADREFLRLQILLKDTRAIAGRPETIRKLVESFIKKHEGTCAAEKARSFVPAAQ